MFSLSLGNIAGGVISIITTLVFAILAFTLAPQVAGNISSIALEGKPERVLPYEQRKPGPGYPGDARRKGGRDRKRLELGGYAY